MKALLAACKSRVVAAQAGTQRLCGFRAVLKFMLGRFHFLMLATAKPTQRHWIPACAGMTSLLDAVSMVVLPNGSDSERCNQETGPCRGEGLLVLSVVTNDSGFH